MALATLSLLLFSAFSFPLSSIAAWDWPDPSPSTWSEAEQLKVCAQIHTALTERCTVVNVTWPTNIETYTCYGGFSNTVYTNDGVVWTGKTILTKSVTVTNAYAPFEYTYTDPQGTSTATGFPTVTRGMLSTFAAKIDVLLPRFVDTNLFNGGELFTNLVFATNYAGLANVQMPLLTREAIVAANGGVLVSSTTNGWGLTNSATAYWWHADEQPFTNVILYIGGRSNAWGTQFASTLAHTNPPGQPGVMLWQFTNVNASARYYWASGSPTSVTMRISGTRIWNTNVISNATADIVFEANQIYPLTGCWRTIASASNVAGTAATGDWIIVSYPTNLYFVQPNGSNFAARAYWRPLSVFRTLLDRMTCTASSNVVSSWTNGFWGSGKTNVTYWPPPSSYDFTPVQTIANTNYAEGSHEEYWILGDYGASAMLYNHMVAHGELQERWIQSGKTANEREVTSITLSTNFAKTATWYAAVCRPGEYTLFNFAGTNSVYLYYTWGLPWLEYRFQEQWNTNLDASVQTLYPFGSTNRLPWGTTAVTNIGSSIPWEVIGSNSVKTMAGYGYYSRGMWLIDWDFPHR